MSKQKKEAPPPALPIALMDVPTFLLNDPGISKREKYKFNNSQLLAISKKIKSSNIIENGQMKKIEQALQELQNTAQKYVSSEYGAIEMDVNIPVPPKPSEVSNYIKINQSLLDISNNICKFDINANYKGNLQPKIASKAPAAAPVQTSTKGKSKASVAPQVENVEESADAVKSPGGVATGAPGSILAQLKSRISNIPDIPENGQNAAKGSCPFASVFESELDHSPLPGINSPKPTESDLNIEESLEPTEIDLSEFSNEPAEKEKGEEKEKEKEKEKPRKTSKVKSKKSK